MLKNFKTLQGKVTFLVLLIILSSNTFVSLVIALLKNSGAIPERFLITFWSSLALVASSGIIGAVLTTISSRRIFKPLDDMSKFTNEVAKGNFSVHIDYQTQVESIDTLIQNFNKMVNELGSIEMFRSDFINNFSHEFKTPIVSICGFAKQLEIGDLSEDEKKQYARIIVENSKHLANMSSMVLLLTKLDNQQILGDKSEYSLDSQIRECILTQQNEWEKKNLEMNIELDKVKYFGNESLMAHVWTNIIGNAIKFTDNNGTISVSMKSGDKKITVKITDNGIGMNDETLSHVFDKFYQGDTAHSTPGNGLGLSLVKRIVTLCCGEIKIDSKEGEGTCVTVILPIEQTQSDGKKL